MPSSFSIRRRVQFSETDLAGIVHFSNFFRYMEEVEHAFYRELGLSVHGMEGGEPGSTVGFPRVHASADFRQPLHFEEEFEMELLVVELNRRTIRYRVRFWKLDDNGASAELAATGELVVVCVMRDGESGKMRAVSIPEGLASRVKVVPEEEIDDKSALRGVNS